MRTIETEKDFPSVTTLKMDKYLVLDMVGPCCVISSLTLLPFLSAAPDMLLAKDFHECEYKTRACQTPRANKCISIGTSELHALEYTCTYLM